MQHAQMLGPRQGECFRGSGDFLAAKEPVMGPGSLLVVTPSSTFMFPLYFRLNVLVFSSSSQDPLIIPICFFNPTPTRY